MLLSNWRRQGALGSLVLALSLCAGSSSAQSGYTTTWDAFSTNFTVGTSSSKWFYFGAGPFVGDDGIETVGPRGLRVRSPGTNPITGEPAYTLTMGQEGAFDNPFSFPGGFDHVKWLAYANNFASTGYPGFDADLGRELRFDVWMSGRGYGNQFHPFGGVVSDPDDDIRLATPAMNTIDFDTFLVADFFLTNKRIYALYERLPFARTPGNNYAAFTYAIPVGTRKPHEMHKLSIAYDRAAGVLRWLVDDVEVYRVDQIGHRIDPQYLVIDHGGDEQLIECRQRNVGFGIFTLLDAGFPGQQPLVRLSTAPDFYFDTALGAPYAPSFVDELSLPGSRVWGAGAEFTVKKVVVSSR